MLPSKNITAQYPPVAGSTLPIAAAWTWGDDDEPALDPEDVLETLDDGAGGLAGGFSGFSSQQAILTSETFAAFFISVRPIMSPVFISTFPTLTSALFPPVFKTIVTSLIKTALFSTRTILFNNCCTFAKLYEFAPLPEIVTVEEPVPLPGRVTEEKFTHPFAID